MKLDIIIPHYKEPIDWVLRVIDSIKKQKHFNFSDTVVTVINDFGAVALDFSKYNFKFKLQQLFMPEKKTIGDLRQYAVDHTHQDYILWCDSDDFFINYKMLYQYSLTVKKHPNVQLIMTPYFSEHLNTAGEYYYRLEDDYATLGVLHGKLFSRKFIDEVNLKFISASFSEDLAYCFTAMGLLKNVVYNVKAASYLYKFNANSVTRVGNPLNELADNIRSFTGSLIAYDKMCETIVKYDSTEFGIFSTSMIGVFLQSTFYFSNLHKILSEMVATKEAIDNYELGKATLDKIIIKYSKYFDDNILINQREMINKNFPFRELFANIEDINFITYYKELNNVK